MWNSDEPLPHNFRIYIDRANPEKCVGIQLLAKAAPSSNINRLLMHIFDNPTGSWEHLSWETI